MTENPTTAQVTGRTIPHSILTAAERHKSKTALVASGGEGESLTFGELVKRVCAVAGGLRTLGIRPGDRVALLGENCPEWAISYLAIQTAGATVVPLDILLKPEEHIELLSESEPKALMLTAKFYNALKERLQTLRNPPQIVCLDCETTGTPLNSLYAGEELPPESIDPDTPASLIFTSGTTGKPKAVILTHRNITSNIASIFTSLKFTSEDRFLSVLPLSHVYECTAGFLTPLHAGARIVYARSLAAPSVIEDMRRNQITVLIGVPLLYEKMSRGMQKKIRSAPPARRFMFKTLYNLSRAGRRAGLNPGKALFKGIRGKAGMDRLKMMVSGGAPLDPAIADFFETLGINFLQGYGMTESSPVISVNIPGNNRIGSVGPPLPGLEVRIDNPNSEGIGEILARGDCVTPGYLNDPKKTGEVLRDGWLCTGDLGKIENGHLYICGRAKNLIVSAGGKNIYPEEIETKLLENELVAEALVLGKKREGRQGEDVFALLYPNIETLADLVPGFDAENPDALLSEKVRNSMAEVVEKTNRELADYKRISSWEIVTEEFEKTASRKIKRAKYMNLVNPG